MSLPTAEMIKDVQLLRRHHVHSDDLPGQLIADVECHILALAAENERLEAELKHARDVANSMIPPSDGRYLSPGDAETGRALPISRRNTHE